MTQLESGAHINADGGLASIGFLSLTSSPSKGRPESARCSGGGTREPLRQQQSTDVMAPIFRLRVARRPPTYTATSARATGRLSLEIWAPRLPTHGRCNTPFPPHAPHKKGEGAVQGERPAATRGRALVDITNR